MKQQKLSPHRALWVLHIESVFYSREVRSQNLSKRRTSKGTSCHFVSWLLLLLYVVYFEITLIAIHFSTDCHVIRCLFHCVAFMTRVKDITA